MVNQDKTLKRLRKERDYEERIAKNITDYCAISQDSIKDLTEKEKITINEKLMIIRDDSLIHEELFNKLIQMVIKKGEGDY